ncbi:MAG: HAD family hydrolase [Halolamina sp.]
MSDDDIRPRAVSVDCFGTLVDVDRPAEPAAAVADALRGRAVAVPEKWPELYRTAHLDVATGRELALDRHVDAALAAGSVDADRETVADAVLAAFDRPPEPRPGAADALAAVDAPLGVLSNCAVPGLVERTLSRAGMAEAVGPVVTSVGCGWRKPDRRAFAAVADALDVAPAELVHVGDNAEADGGVTEVGGRFVLVGESAEDGTDDERASLAALPEALPAEVRR